MRIQVNRSVDVSDLLEARKLILDALSKEKCRLTFEDHVHLTAERGSQAKMRILGGMMVNFKVLPVGVSVSFMDGRDGPGTVTVLAYDNLGFGSFAGMYDKYLHSVEDLARIVVDSVSPIAGPGRTSSGSNSSISASPGSEFSFCPSCGTKYSEAAAYCARCGGARSRA